MAKIERVTVFCDGLCGGNEIEGSGHPFSLRPQGLANRSVDLCDDCAATLRSVYDKGVVIKAGRPPRTRREAPARPSTEPTITNDGATVSPAQTDPMTVADDDGWSEPVEAFRPTTPSETPVGTGT